MDPVLEALKKELEIEAGRDQVPIIRGPERSLLLSAAEKASPKRILEIGTAIGYSSLLLAERFPLAEIDTLEIDPARHARAEEVMRAASFSQRVHCHLGDAAELLETLEGPYDFLYLDGPKGQYLRQLKAMCARLYPVHLNIDYYPTNFVLSVDRLYYVDYECNDYSPKWDFEHWGAQYWTGQE